MIIIKLSGGIGNQMFQYAAGYSLARRNRTELLLDLSSYSKNSIHNGYELFKVFSIETSEATNKELESIIGLRSNRLFYKLIEKYPLKILCGNNFYIQPFFHFDPSFDLVKENSLLTGYFQSEKYFLRYRKSISRIYAQCNKLNNLKGMNKKHLHKILNSNSISIHVRRGDYLTNIAAFNVHGVCSSSYYIHAISHLKSLMKNLKFFVFSDDVVYSRLIFKGLSNITYIENNIAEHSYLDMFLMSACKHNIIANSTFSWWAAWLNKNQNKVVIAPRKWFKSSKYTTTDLFPSDWILIDE